MPIRRMVRNLLYGRSPFQGIADRFVLKNTQSTVVGGPFEGMRYVMDPEERLGFFPKLLGTLEKELAGVINEVIADSYPTIINLGAAEGYYAVGLARSIPTAKIFAFEAIPRHRKLLSEMAKANDVDERIEILGFCDVGALSEVLDDGEDCFIIMDIEGDERILLDPFPVPRLSKCFILVEIHEFRFPDVGHTIETRFSPSHEITEILQEDRTWDDFPLQAPVAMRIFFSKVLLNTMREGRPGRMRWFAMRPRTSEAAEQSELSPASR